MGGGGGEGGSGGSVAKKGSLPKVKRLTPIALPGVSLPSAKRAISRKAKRIHFEPARGSPGKGPKTISKTICLCVFDRAKRGLSRALLTFSRREPNCVCIHIFHFDSFSLSGRAGRVASSTEAKTDAVSLFAAFPTPVFRPGLRRRGLQIVRTDQLQGGFHSSDREEVGPGAAAAEGRVSAAVSSTTKHLSHAVFSILNGSLLIWKPPLY